MVSLSESMLKPRECMFFQQNLPVKPNPTAISNASSTNLLRNNESNGSLLLNVSPKHHL